MAAGMFTKQATFQTSKYLNDVNDPLGGPQIQSVPGGIAPQFDQDYPGDRICLDDATAYALSDTTVGTLYGGIYEYVITKSGSTAAPALGVPAFYLAADIGATTTGLNYEVTPDANPTAAAATFLQGVYISAPTKGNQCWIQVSGIATVQYQATVTDTAAGDSVTVGITQTPPGFDAGVATFTKIIMAAMFGVAITAPSNGGTGKVGITRMINRI